MIHQTINCILVIVLIVLFLVCCCYPSAPAAEPFFDYTLTQAMGPFKPSADDVGAKYPPQRRDDASWTYATPFQGACVSGPDPAKCKPADIFTCYLTPHNQRKCEWGVSSTNGQLTLN